MWPELRVKAKQPFHNILSWDYRKKKREAAFLFNKLYRKVKLSGTPFRCPVPQALLKAARTLGPSVSHDCGLRGPARTLASWLWGLRVVQGVRQALAVAMALGPFPPLAVKGTQESKARGGAQQQSQPGLGAAQDPQSRHAAPAAHVNHRQQAGGDRGREIRERDPPTPKLPTTLTPIRILRFPPDPCARLPCLSPNLDAASPPTYPQP